MSEVFQQDLSDEERPGGPFLMQLLFREAVPFPGQEEMSAVLARHCGEVECFCCDEKMAALRRWIILWNLRTVPPLYSF